MEVAYLSCFVIKNSIYFYCRILHREVPAKKADSQSRLDKKLPTGSKKAENEGFCQAFLFQELGSKVKTIPNLRQSRSPEVGSTAKL